MPKKPSGTLKPVVDFARSKGRSRQWELLKRLLRTGKRSPGLRWETIKMFSRLGFRHKEAMNRKRKRPYTGVFSREEKKEIRKQVMDAIDMLKPMPKNERAEKLKDILDGTEAIMLHHVNEAIGEPDVTELFLHGKMYLDALDPRNALNGRATATETRFGYTDKASSIVMSANWLASSYGATTPFHEAVHILFPGATETKVLAGDFYYSMKRGIMSEPRLVRYTMNRSHELAARRKAISLFRYAKEHGAQAAELELRKYLGNKKSVLHKF